MIEDLETRLDTLRAEIPEHDLRYKLDYIQKQLGIPEPSNEHSDLRLFGRVESTRYQVADMGGLLLKSEYLEKKLASVSPSEQEKDVVRFMLAREVYPRMCRVFHDFANKSQYGWLHLKRDLTHSIFEVAGAAEQKQERIKTKIRSKQLLKHLLYAEAEEFDRKNTEKLVLEKNPAWGSPSNRGVLTDAADKWVLAGQFDKAEEYYLRAGRYEYSHAASMFEKAKDKERATKFWTLRAQNPTGYSDAMDYESARCWEKVGNIPEAIKAYERAIDCYEGQEGSYDLHGDPKPGNEEAAILRQRVDELTALLKEGKSLKRDRRKESVQSIFTFPVKLT